MTQQNKTEAESQLEPKKPGGKIDETFPDGIGKVPGSESSTTSKTEYDNDQLKTHGGEIAGMLKETSDYGGHGVAARSAGIDKASNDDGDGDYDTTRTKGGS